MRFWDAVCDIAVARDFLERCSQNAPKFSNPVVNALYDWQTLITGLLALAGAILLWIQIRDQRQQYTHDREQTALERKRENLAARIGLPHALSELNIYWKACLQAWKQKDPDVRPKPPPLSALKTIMDAAVLVDEATYSSMQKLIIYAQAFEARVGMPVAERPINFFETMIVDIARLSYLTNRLYDFGRMSAEQVAYVPPNRQDLESEIRRDMGMFMLPPDHEYHQRVREALDMAFGKEKAVGANNTTEKTE